MKRDQIFMVNRNDWLWGIQVSVAIISLAETLLLTYLGYKVSICCVIACLRFTKKGRLNCFDFPSVTLQCDAAVCSRAVFSCFCQSAFTFVLPPVSDAAVVVVNARPGRP